MSLLSTEDNYIQYLLKPLRLLISIMKEIPVQKKEQNVGFSGTGNQSRGLLHAGQLFIPLHHLVRLSTTQYGERSGMRQHHATSQRQV